MSRLVLLCAFLAVSLPGIKAQDCEGVLIGELPTLFHDVSGMLYAVDDRTFCIDEFTYDGLGPDAFIYFYYPGDRIDDTGGGVIIPLPGMGTNAGQFTPGTPYNNTNSDETFTFTLPENQYVGCDFEGFGIWCRYANQLFTNITWTTADVYSTTDMADRITCEPSPGRGYVGDLPTLAHSVNGFLYVRDNKTLVIEDFAYDGLGPDAFIYWYEIGVELDNTGNGEIIPLSAPIGNTDEEGRFVDNVSYDGSTDLVITIPESLDVYACDIGNFTVWCRQASQFFTTIELDIDTLFTNNPLERDYEPNRILCNRPSTRPGVYVGELPTDNPRVLSGTFYVRSRRMFIIQLFSYDGSRDNLFIYYFPPGVEATSSGEGGFVVEFSDTEDSFPSGRSNSFYNMDFIIDMQRAQGDPANTCDVGTISFIDTDINEVLSTIAIPDSAFSEDGSEEGTVMCVSAGALPAFSTLGLLGAVAMALLAHLFRA